MAKLQNCYIEREEKRREKIELNLRNLEFDAEPEKKTNIKLNLYQMEPT